MVTPSPWPGATYPIQVDRNIMAGFLTLSAVAVVVVLLLLAILLTLAVVWTSGD